jgi:hypothetical protein
MFASSLFDPNHFDRRLSIQLDHRNDALRINPAGIPTVLTLLKAGTEIAGTRHRALRKKGLP